MKYIRLLVFLLMLVFVFPVEAAIDSYRFLHVTIATPWYIFLFLLMGVFSPFILMAVLMWHNVARKNGLGKEDGSDQDHTSD